MSRPGVRLRTYALAAAARSLSGAPASALDGAEAAFLLDQLRAVAGSGEPWSQSLDQYLSAPDAADGPLLDLGAFLELTAVELLTVALAAAAEQELMVGRALSFLQAPVGGSRPTVGLLASIFREVSGRSGGMEQLVTGNALGSGLLLFADDRPPLAERAVCLPAPLFNALSRYAGTWPDSVIGDAGGPHIPLPSSTMQEAARQAAALGEQGGRSLIVRTSSPAEGRVVLTAICAHLGTRPLFMEKEHLPGLGPYLRVANLTPVFCCDPAPGDRHVVPQITFYDGSILVLGGPDGSIEVAGGAALSWSLDMPSRDERRQLWQAALGDERLAEGLSRYHRHGAGRIAHLGRLAKHQSALRGVEQPTEEDVVAASWSSEGVRLDGLAEPLKDRIDDDALILPPMVRAELDLLLLRCRARDGLVDGLGASSRARYRQGVRVLLTGPSGSGKTLATGWLATKLGIPLYRVDLSAVMSKYIGETEKNLAQLLSRAEQADIMLLFDEADSLFGKRTEVKEANDRFANAQTNYLLQRIESFDGITLLTSNSRNRFDAAFTRRLDAIVEIPLPGPEERRSLWFSHLGDGHDVTDKEINQFAAVADIGGGHIRNVVLTAAVMAHDPPRPIGYADLLAGLSVEYRKLGRQLPPALNGVSGSRDRI